LVAVEQLHRSGVPWPAQGLVAEHAAVNANRRD
jgi:hypothetical protein